ncbi:MAG: response regulator [Bacteroides sp.]|nr:response regulator [Bacteroides sp.]
MEFKVADSFLPKVILCILWQLCAPAFVYGGAAVNRYVYTVDDGLPSSQVYDIVQDRSGFIWFGTSNGLSRFDGHNFRNYRKNDGSGLSNNSVLHLHVDRTGRIWVTLDNGVDIYSPESDTFEHFDKKTADGLSISGRAIDILEDMDGDIWITTVNQGLFRYSAVTDSLIVYLNNPDDDGTISQNYISTVYESHDGTIWLGTYSSGLCAIDRKTDAVTRYTRDENGLSGNSIDAIAEDSYGNLWIGTVNNGLDCLDRTTGQVRNMGNGECLYRIHRIEESALGKLIVCSDMGAMAFNIMDGKIEPCMQNEDGYVSTEVNYVYAFLKDREGNLWFGSSDSGVEFHPSSTLFTCYETADSHDPKTGKIVTSICDYGEGRYWLGTRNNGIMLLDAGKETIVQSFVPSYHVLSLVLDGDVLWAAVYDRGICSIDLCSGRIRSYMDGKNDARVFSLLKAGNSRIYAGAADGLYFYDVSTDSFSQLRESSRVTDIDEDRNGILWMSTSENGIYSYNPRNGECCEHVHSEDDMFSIVGNSVNTLSVDDSNVLWIGTNDGLCSYDGQRFRSYPELGLPDDNISEVIPDGERIWVSTDNGLAEFHVDTGDVNVYRQQDGLLSQQFSKNAGIYSSTGQILLGSVNGVAAFWPDRMDSSVPLPPAVITELLINNIRIYPYLDDSPITRPIEKTGELVLSHRQSFIGLRFASPSYIMAGNIRYRFRLDRKRGEDSWHMLEGHAPVYYNLRPGKYVFRVQAAAGNGGWGPDETVLHIKVKAPVMKSTGAYIVYGAMVLLMIACVVIAAFRRNRERYRMRMLQLEGCKEQELNEMKISFFTNVAHEIRTPLSLIVGPLEYIMQDKEVCDRYNEYFHVIEKNNKRLYELVNQLLDFNKSSFGGGSYVVHYDSCCLSRIIDQIVEMFSFSAEKKGVTIHREYPDNMSMVIDSEAITKIINNIVSNAVKFADSEVRISASLSESGLSVRVTDDGPGVPEESREKVFELFYQVNGGHRSEGIGIGLHLVRMLVSLLGGEIHVEERQGSDGNPCRGAVFVLAIPYTEHILDSGTVPEGHVTAMAEEASDTCVASGKRILAVDDNADMIAFLQKILSSGYDVSVAYNGEEALEMLHKADFDMVVSDVMMPGMSGIELCRMIKNDIRTSHVPVVLLTAKIDNGSKIESLESGVDAYIEKPFSPKHLLAQISNLLKKNTETMKDFAKTPLVEVRQLTRNRLDKEFIEKCSALVIDNMGNADMSVDVLARELALSRTAVFRKLKAITGMTPNDFMKFVRLNEACRLLVEGKYSITEIGYITGFSSSSYFAKCFSKQFGMLPSDFVKNVEGDAQQGDFKE